jgi:Zn-dependent M28 family amino/carboxypeptidase
MRQLLFSTALTTALAFAAMNANADPITLDDTKALRDAVTVPNIVKHERALQAIATRNNGTRASGTPGFMASLRYIKGKLEEAGYFANVLSFEFPFFTENTPASLEQLSPHPIVYNNPNDIAVMQYSGAGDVTAQIQAVGGIVIPPTPEPSSDSGCKPEHFNGFVPGRIALIQRGTCLFADKAANAKAAGASAVIIFNEGNPNHPERIPNFLGTLGGPADTPVLSSSFAVGEALFNTPTANLHLVTDTVSETRRTANLVAGTRNGDLNNAVVVGAHLDSRLEGPGIQDNGSGSTTILEIAIQLAKLRGTEAGHLRNQIRFMWYGAEEEGLLGSTDYVNSLTPGELDQIGLMLNFDMIASPNFVRFVYDGDGSATGTAGPPGSDFIERVFNSYYHQKSLVTDPTAFDGRSDYGPFIAVGIPAGGLFSGAEQLKTVRQAILYGGSAGIAYDTCYHLACDDINNLNFQSLDQMSDAAAHTVLFFGKRDLPPRPPMGSAANRSRRVSASSILYRGPRLQK